MKIAEIMGRSVADVTSKATEIASNLSSRMLINRKTLVVGWVLTPSSWNCPISFFSAAAADDDCSSESDNEEQDNYYMSKRKAKRAGKTSSVPTKHPHGKTELVFA